MPTIALATSEKWPHLSPDDVPLLAPLREFGIDAVPAIWSDHDVDWSRFAAVVIRSCWDYHLRRDEFLRWMESIEPPVFNPRDVIAWNSHKRYLLDMRSRGVRIPRTRLIRETADNDDGTPLIIKPAVSASAYETHKTSSAEDARAIRERLLRMGDVIVQEFIPDIARIGEWSIVFFDRQFSHAVKKRPKPGDFRVQEELGGSAVLESAPEHVIDAARGILNEVDGDLLYARVDVVERPEGVTLMELELIEPMLFLRLDSEAPRRFAAAIADRVL